MVNRNSEIRIRNLLPYKIAFSEDRNRKFLFTICISYKKFETIPTKGFVKKFTVKTTMATVTARGSKMTRPVIKYFFIVPIF